MDAWIEIQHPDGRKDMHRLRGSRITIGSAEPATLVLPDLPFLLPEHLLLVPRTQGCWVATAQEASVVTRYEGKQSRAIVVLWEDSFELGNINLRLTLKPPRTKNRESQKRRRLWLATAALVLPALALLMLAGPDQPAAQAAVPVPPLFERLVRCPEAEDGPVVRRAMEAEQAANYKIERYPYAPRDGIVAVNLLNLSSLCYHAAGLEDRAARASRDRDRFAQRIMAEVRAHRLKFSRSLKTGRVSEALEAGYALYALVGHRSRSPFVLRLRATLKQVKMASSPSGEGS